MTTYNQTTLKTFFETGDVPSGSDYANLIDSCLNVVNTGAQSLGGALQATELIASRVSAGNVNVTGTMTISGQASAGNLSLINLNIASQTSALDMNISGEFIRPVVNYIAAGTSQATATVVSAGNSFLTGAVDGQTTGYRLMANKTGLVQNIYNQNTVSANLYPCVGGQINVLASNAAFGMAASTMYTVLHVRASGYAVK